MTARTSRTVVLLDVDNTLLDNDRFADDLRARLAQDFGERGRDDYWSFYERRRDAMGYADYLGAAQDFRALALDNPAWLTLSDFLLEYPFEERVYPGTSSVLGWLRECATPVVFSDGDAVFQPRKVRRAGIWAAVEGRILIEVHKQEALARVEARYPAPHYVMVDDKPGLLAEVKGRWAARVTTVFVRQGHYARAAEGHPVLPPPDRVIDAIGELPRLAEHLPGLAAPR